MKQQAPRVGTARRHGTQAPPRGPPRGAGARRARGRGAGVPGGASTPSRELPGPVSGAG